MKVLNVHERELHATPEQVGALIDSLASGEAALWPKHSWPRMEFDRPLGVGARGGHGPIRYFIEEYVPGKSVKFRFTGPKGFDGFHGYDRVETAANTAALRHTLKMTTHGPAILSWPVIYRPMHDALIEDSLATAEASLGQAPRIQPWSPWVRFLRWVVSRGKASAALGAEEAFRMSSNMRPSWYERHVLPYLIDIACGIRPVWRQRHKVVPLAQGRVLEIGIGTGLNLEHYDKAKIEKVVGLDPGLEMHHLAQKRVKRAGLAVELVGLSAEQIPYQDGTFDTVLVTYSLCTIPDPGAALKEMRRVLKPGGKLIFCEHGLAPDASVRRWQDRLTPLWSKLAGGCHLNRDIPGLLKEAGFQSADMQSMYLPGPRPLTYNYWGTAVAV